MSGPLARSAHMRMKMKREKGAPSPRNAPPSPANQTVAKELLLAAAVASTATLSSEVSEKEPAVAQQSDMRAPSPRSLSSPVAVRSRSRSKNKPRVRGGINSLQSEGEYVVDNVAPPTAPSPRFQQSNATQRNSPSGFKNMSSPRHQPQPIANPISPTHPRSIFNSASPRNFSSRSRKSYEFPQQQYDISGQMESVQQQNEDQLSPKEEAFDPFAPSPLTVPTDKRSTNLFAEENFGFDDGYEQPQSYESQYEERAHQSRSPPNIDTQVSQHDPVDELNVYSPNHKDGSKMMTIEGHDDNFVYPESYEDHPDADLEYHTNKDEQGSIAPTVDSEDVQTGTPVRKKHKKKKKRIMIENVGSADSLDKHSARYAIHNKSWEEDEENVMPRSGSKVRGHSLKYNEIVATAKRYEGMDERRKKEALSPIEGEGRKVVLPQRIGVSRSWDSSQVDGEVRPIASSKSWDVPSESDSHGWRKTAKKQRNIWIEEDYDESDEKSPARQKQFIGASKPSTNDDERDVNAGFSNQGVNFNQDGFFQTDPFGVTPPQEAEDAAVEETFADWDGTGPEWADITHETEEAASDMPPLTKSKEDLDWNKNGAEHLSSMIPVEFETPHVSEQVSDYEEDEDSIFAFENKEEEVKPNEPPPPPANPRDIFAKLNKGLKQAESNKSRALRGDQLSNTDSDFSKDASEPTSEKSKPVEKRNVAFAKDKDNTIHTYLVEESHFDSRDSASQVESTDDEEMETDPESSVDVDKEAERSGSPRNTNAVSVPANDGSTSPRNFVEDQQEQAARKKKSVHYQSDEDTFHTNEESTMGSSFKSNRSGITTEQEEPNELNLLDHVAGLAASLGGLFASPTNAGDAVKEHDDKSLSDQDDNTYGQSTLISQDNTEKSDDWLGYMEKVLFPTQEETGYSGEQSVNTGSHSVNTESEYTESNYTESQFSESQAQSSKYTYEDSYADEDDDEAYLLQQALASARAVHHMHGVEYDELQEIDVLSDVKFHVVNIKLPLGLLFQEHEIGAWVSRVVPDGNGARKGVQHGDQLASINGKSAVHASIDEVAATISRTPKNQSVELTFLRYVGPLKPMPGAIIQEGFEVTDTSVNKKTSIPPRPPKQKTKSPGKGKSRFFNRSPPSSPKESPSPGKSPSSKQKSPSSPTEKVETFVAPETKAGRSDSRLQKKTIETLGKNQGTQEDNVIQEGFEVNDSSVNKKTQAGESNSRSPKKTMKALGKMMSFKMKK